MQHVRDEQSWKHDDQGGQKTRRGEAVKREIGDGGGRARVKEGKCKGREDG